MASEALAQGISNFVSWGIFIISVMMVWEIYQLIKGGSQGGGPGSSGESKVWKAIKERVPFIHTKAKSRRLLKKEINEEIKEEEEERELDNLKDYALQIVEDLEAIGSQGKFANYGQKEKVEEMVTKFGEKIKEAKETFRQLSKRTSRADRGLDNLYKYVQKENIRIPQDVKALENKIILLHQRTGTDIAEVEKLYREIIDSVNMRKLNELKDSMFINGEFELLPNSQPFDTAHLWNLIKAFKQEEFLLEDAYKYQAEAKKELVGIMSATKELYK
ncbi:MAG: hypothetical protein AABX05_05970 [Nanoarchaeota archaeon]